MELKLNSWYSKWYSFVYLTSNKPKDLCTFFWKLIVSPFVWILGNPLWIFAFIWSKWTNRNVYWVWLLIPMIFNMVFLIVPEEEHWYERVINGWVALIILIIMSISFVTFSVGFAYMLEKLIKLSPKKIVSQIIKDFKNKTCMLIKWK